MTKGVPMRNYVSCQTDCGNCPKRNKCVTDKTTVRKIRRHPCQEFMEAGRTRVGSYAYRSVLRRRQAVCEGNFGLQKRCHNLRFTRKRGIENVLEQCLLSATAPNLKRLVKGLSLSRVPGGMSAISALPTRDFVVFTPLILACVYLRGGTASAMAFCQQTHFCKAVLRKPRNSGRGRFVGIKTKRSAVKLRLKSPVFPRKSPFARRSFCARVAVRVRERSDSGRLWWERSSATSGGAVRATWSQPLCGPLTIASNLHFI